MSVVVKIQDSTGSEIGSFEAEDEKSLCEMAAMHGIDILKSCGAGFC
jgi:ferredoxin